MRRNSAWRIQRVLLLLLISILLPVVLLQAAIYYSQFKAQRDDELRANLELARAVALTFDRYLQDILSQEQTLGVTLSETPTPSPAQARRLLTIAAQAHPTILRFNWVNPEGRITVSSEPRAIGLDVRDRVYTQSILQGHEVIVTDLYQALVHQEPTFAVARGMRDGHGRLLGIIVGLVNPAKLDQVLSLERVSGGAIILCDRQGQVVYRYPPVKLTWQQRMAHSVLVSATTGQPHSGIITSRIDGKLRLSGSVPISSIGWALGASRPVDIVLGPIARRLLRDFSVLLAVIVAVVLFALHLSRAITIPLHRLRLSARLIGDGQLAHQAEIIGPHELRELAEAFNDMARQLQIRDGERDIYLHTISHDLRNPFHHVVSAAQSPWHIRPVPECAGLLS